jgi:hypothetical protein
MRTFTDSVKPLAAASLLLAAATACSSSSAIPPTFAGAATAGAAPASRPVSLVQSDAGRARPEKKKVKPLLYAANYETGQILVFEQAKKGDVQTPKYTIDLGKGTAPEGITTDESGNLYVTNTKDNEVEVFPLGATSPSKTITAGLNGPQDVAVDASGNLYVSNQPGVGSGSDYISEYPAGSSSPSFTWNPPSGDSDAELTGITLTRPTADGNSTILASMDILNSYYGTYTGDVAACIPGNSTCFDEGYSLGFVQGIAMEQSPTASSGTTDFLVVDKQIPGYDNIYDYSTITQVSIAHGSIQPVPNFLTFNPERTELYISADGTVYEYSYPSMKPIATYTNGGNEVTGVATYPSGNYL